MENLCDIEIKNIDGQAQTLRDFAGKVLLLVNVASKCGLTPQYTGLERLQQRFGEQGFSVLGFPCNQFLQQEPGTESEIKAFCEANYHVTFPLFSKVEVNGQGRHPLYAHLTALPTKPSEAGDIQWNFEKFLIGRDGAVLARFTPSTEPEAEEILSAINTALKA